MICSEGSSYERSPAVEAIEALLTRVTFGQFLEPSPGATVISLLVQAAMRAPDHGRLRPWRFTIIQGAGRLRLGELMAQALKRHTPSASEVQLQRERAKALRAPLIVAVGAKIHVESKIPSTEQLMAVGAAAQNMLLAAHALGFGGAWKTGDAAYAPEVKAALNLDENDAIVGFLYIGSVAAKEQVARVAIDPAPYISHWAD